MMVKFIINYFWLDANACSQIAKSVLEMLGSDRACDGGAVLLQKRIKCRCATLLHELHDIGGGLGARPSKKE